MTSQRSHLKWYSSAIVAAALFAELGCSDGRPPTYSVTGIVQFSDGKPVRTGTVEFRSEQFKLNARGKIDSSGKFELGTFEMADGAVAGMHQVIVTQIVAPPDSRPAPRGHQHTTPTTLRVAAKYGRNDTSGLTANIQPNARNYVTLEVEPYDRP